MKVIENLPSKIDSLSGRNSENTNTGANEFQSENIASTSRSCDTDSMTQDEGLYMVTGVTNEPNNNTHPSLDPLACRPQIRGTPMNSSMNR